MDFGTIILGVAIVLFGIALAALMIWAFKAFFGKSGGGAARKAREKRLALMETFAVDSKRTLYLFRRDDTEHLVLIGGPVDIVVEQGIKVRPQVQPQPHHLNPPHDDVIIAKTEARPPTDYGKT